MEWYSFKVRSALNRLEISPVYQKVGRVQVKRTCSREAKDDETLDETRSLFNYFNLCRCAVFCCKMLFMNYRFPLEYYYN
jgi:hypothetical protein